MMAWVMLMAGVNPDYTPGELVDMLSDLDPRPAREQLNEGYQHGGGWCPMEGFTIDKEGLHFPGDRALRPICMTKLRDETITVFEADWVVIQQPDGTFEVARMD